MVGRGLIWLTSCICIGAATSSSPAQEIGWTGAEETLYVSNPPGFEVACRRYDWLCANFVDEPILRPEEELRWLAAAINRDVNREVQQATDREVHGTDEKWALPNRGRGDCEDFVLEKMYRLLNRNVPAEMLAIAVVLDSFGNNHAVLLLRTGNSYVVLDSLTDRLLSPQEAYFRIIAVQSTRDRSRWVIPDRNLLADLIGSQGVRETRPPVESGKTGAQARLAAQLTSEIRRPVNRTGGPDRRIPSMR